MPVHKAAYKSIRQDRKKHQRNLKITTELKTLNKKFASLIGSKNTAEAKKSLTTFISKLDKAVTKGIIPKNRASRKKSRLVKQIGRLERG